MHASTSTPEATPREADHRLVRFNVGGKSFVTYASTLRAYPDCLLARMVDGNFTPSLAEDGSFFVDRDGSRFRYVLDYMRGVNDAQGQVLLPTDLYELQGLYDDAAYYGLTELANMTLCPIDAKLREQEARHEIMKEKHRKVKAEKEKRRKAETNATIRIKGHRVVTSRGHCSTSSESSDSSDDCCS
ncbi:BTB domain protein [Mollivirus kamchatka]|nr:BTB domain protein [Mollivirus kamchatka]